MLCRAALAVAALVLSACVAGPVQSGPRATLAVTDGFIVDPDRDAPAAAGTILVAGSTIVAAGRDVKVPRGTPSISARGKYVVPGLWDMHSHIAADGSEPDALERYAGHGVLGIRDMGGYPDRLFAMRRDVASGSRTGPTIVLAGPTLNSERSADFHRLVRSGDEARQAVRELRSQGADFIKIHRRTSAEAFAAIAQETQSLGIKFGGHVPLTMDWVTAANSGMDSIEHIQTLAENQPVKDPDPAKSVFATVEQINGERGSAIIAAMARNGSAFTPTLIFYENGWARDAPERKRLKQQFYAAIRPFVRRAASGGVTILAGSDMLSEQGAMLLDELDRLVASGLTRREALAAATTNPRRWTGRGPGRLTRGEEASFLIVDGDPLQDFGALKRLSAVILRGRLIDAATLARLRSTGK